MLPPWSKFISKLWSKHRLWSRNGLWTKHGTLAISKHGIAFKVANAPAKLLTQNNFLWSNSAQLAEVLIENQALLEHLQVHVLLSNTMIRYLVLPWQEAVFARKDWLAIAQHAFRKQYGAVAETWRVSLNIGAYGETVVAAAVDESLLVQLESSSKLLNFTIGSVQPLLMTLLNITPQPNHDWALIAEPERLVLCRTHNNVWQQIIVDSPPTGLEYEKAEQLISRQMLQAVANEQPRQIDSYISAAFHKTWQNSQSKKQKIMLKTTAEKAHALWMADLPLQHSANKINLDFSEKSQTNHSFSAWGLLAIALLAASFLYSQYQQTTKQIILAESKIPVTLATKPNLSSTSASEEKIKLAQQVQRQLDLPWMPMLAALETVKLANPQIAILSISPNKNRAEIKLTGQTAEFSDLTHFLDALRTNSHFSDAVLVSQHLEDDQAKLLYVFDINLVWRI
ncbi:MAG: PilN domain-containing protein [Methylotenera sp.]|uniref:PilN domain-containing protein n=1 Tax=Methylotenera sp. TaxID=2051956 RepID=UPI0017E22C22|nr:PilN domain-containing protein [Methylotenera sp.]NOU25059.1 PilN domain-containing protein [Methylotenera sp.]